ncbi:hypothetical protein X943_001908 [Babesia divergens]|uniref:Uncharacterized protein n=1 Tax=Babesia divergens TaxID=32595 RepID=A0AAD9GK89_BABDI|nr:hypothetical protein X943_001908 [Babesia divergens]
MDRLDSCELDTSLFLSLSGRRQPEDYSVISAEASVLWASTLVSNHGFQRHELLHIARGFARSEFSGFAVQVIITSPFSLCRIYSNGRLFIMGNLTESQARKQLKRVVHKLRYRTRWKVLTQPSQVPHGNGLRWCYIIDRNIVPVKTALHNFKVDQMCYKVVFDRPFDLQSLLKKGRQANYNITMISNTCLRLHVDLPQPLGDTEPRHELVTTTPVWDAGLELERELEAELSQIDSSPARFATCIIYNSGKVAILGCCNSIQARSTYDVLVTML